jgi:hypothetical protein
MVNASDYVVDLVSSIDTLGTILWHDFRLDSVGQALVTDRYRLICRGSETNIKLLAERGGNFPKVSKKREKQRKVSSAGFATFFLLIPYANLRHT